MTSMDSLLDGFVYFLSNTVFGNALLFVVLFLIIITILFMISGTPIEQILIFLIIPAYSIKDTLLTGVMGLSLLAILGFINAYFLYKSITRLLAV